MYKTKIAELNGATLTKGLLELKDEWVTMKWSVLDMIEFVESKSIGSTVSVNHSVTVLATIFAPFEPVMVNRAQLATALSEAYGVIKLFLSGDILIVRRPEGDDYLVETRSKSKFI